MSDQKSAKSQSSHGDHLGPNRGAPGPSHDPVNLMAQIFEDIAAFVGPAPDVLLSWLLRLTPDIAPDVAARSVLDQIANTKCADASPEGVELIELLEQVATQGTADFMAGSGRRRGGRAARVRD